MNALTDIWNRWRSLYEARNEPESIRPLAELYWRSLIALALVLIACILVWAAWEFVSVLDALSNVAPIGKAPTPSLNRKALEETIAAFQQRQTDFQTMQTSHATIADPSK